MDKPVTRTTKRNAPDTAPAEPRGALGGDRGGRGGRRGGFTGSEDGTFILWSASYLPIGVGSSYIVTGGSSSTKFLTDGRHDI